MRAPLRGARGFAFAQPHRFFGNPCRSAAALRAFLVWTAARRAPLRPQRFPTQAREMAMAPSFVLFFASALGVAQLATGVRVPREIPYTPDVKTAPAIGAPEIVESASPSPTVETPPARSA